MAELKDIAKRLARICRFAGRGRWFASDLDHSLVVWLLSACDERSGAVQRQCLLHDICETEAGEVPNGHKTDAQRAHEKEVQRGMLAALGVPNGELGGAQGTVKGYDVEAGDSEAHLLGNVPSDLDRPLHITPRAKAFHLALRHLPVKLKVWAFVAVGKALLGNARRTPGGHTLAQCDQLVELVRKEM